MLDGNTQETAVEDASTERGRFSGRADNKIQNAFAGSDLSSVSFGIAFSIDCADGETDYVETQIISACERLSVDEVHAESGDSEQDHKTELASSESYRELYGASSSASAPGETSTVIPHTARMQAQSLVPDLEARPGEAVADPPPLGLRNAFGYLIANHPKVMSTVSTVLITVGGIVLLPGFSELAAGSVLGDPAVKLAGAIAIAVGKWLRARVASAVARAALQVQQ